MFSTTMNDPDAARVSVWRGGQRTQATGRGAWAIYAGKRHGLIFQAYNLPDLPPQKAYELLAHSSVRSADPRGNLQARRARNSASIVNMDGAVIALSGRTTEGVLP